MQACTHRWHGHRSPRSREAPTAARDTHAGFAVGRVRQAATPRRAPHSTAIIGLTADLRHGDLGTRYASPARRPAAILSALGPHAGSGTRDSSACRMMSRHALGRASPATGTILGPVSDARCTFSDSIREDRRLRPVSRSRVSHMVSNKRIEQNATRYTDLRAHARLLIRNTLDTLAHSRYASLHSSVARKLFATLSGFDFDPRPASSHSSACHAPHRHHRAHV